MSQVEGKNEYHTFFPKLLVLGRNWISASSFDKTVASKIVMWSTPARITFFETSFPRQLIPHISTLDFLSLHRKKVLHAPEGLGISCETFNISLKRLHYTSKFTSTIYRPCHLAHEITSISVHVWLIAFASNGSWTLSSNFKFWFHYFEKQWPLLWLHILDPSTLTTVITHSNIQEHCFAWGWKMVITFIAKWTLGKSPPIMKSWYTTSKSAAELAD